MSGPTQIIPDEAKFITAKQAYTSPRWNLSRSTFYRMIEEGLIRKIFPIPGGNPVYSVAEIDALYEVPSENQSGDQSGDRKIAAE